MRLTDRTEISGGNLKNDLGAVTEDCLLKREW